MEDPLIGNEDDQNDQKMQSIPTKGSLNAVNDSEEIDLMENKNDHHSKCTCGCKWCTFATLMILFVIMVVGGLVGYFVLIPLLAQVESYHMQKEQRKTSKHRKRIHATFQLHLTCYLLLAHNNKNSNNNKKTHRIPHALSNLPKPFPTLF